MLPYREEDAAPRLMLQVKYLDLCFEAGGWKDKNEMMGDRFNKEYAHLLDMSEQYVGLHLDVESSAGTGPTTRPGFCVGTALIANLAGTAWYCRDPKVRRQCIALIRKINLRGVADSEYLAAVSEKVLELEEAQARISCGKGPDEELCQAIFQKKLVLSNLRCAHIKATKSTGSWTKGA